MDSVNIKHVFSDLDSMLSANITISAGDTSPEEEARKNGARLLLEQKILTLVAEYSDIFGNTEIKRELPVANNHGICTGHKSATVYIGNGKFWSLDMKITDLSNHDATLQVPSILEL
jgi:hypothetical protein